MHRAVRFTFSAGMYAACGFALWAQDKTQSESPVLLAPFIVTSTPVPKHPWRYSSIAGVEILTRAEDWKTDWWINGLQRDFALQAVLLPENYLGHYSTPSTLILDETSPERAPMAAVAVKPTESTSTIRHGELQLTVRMVNAFSAPISSWDSDTFAGQCNLFGVTQSNPLVTNGWSLPYRLAVLAPSPPAWLRAGLCGKYGLMDTDIGGFMLSSSYSGASGLGTGVMELDGEAVDELYAGKSLFWLTDARTKELQALADNPNRPYPPIVILPPDQLFSSIAPKPEQAALWACESGLFVRWALFGNPRGTLVMPGYAPANVALRTPTRAAAFWRFVAGTAHEPVTEKYFRECFGMGYARLQAELSGCLPTATREQPIIPPFGPIPHPVFRLATNDEQGRILGDWLRMKGESLQGSDPGLALLFFRETGKVLERAYRGDLGMPTDPELAGGSPSTEHGHSAGPVVVMQPLVVNASRIRDAALLAVYGLYEHDIGDDVKARELLEAAYKAGAARPRADCELALLRLSEAEEHPGGPAGKLSAAQTEYTLAPLQKARLLTPYSVRLYGIMAECWVHSAEVPKAADLDFLGEALDRFPRDTAFACNAATLYVKFGFRSEALRVVDRALPFATDTKPRDILSNLRIETQRLSTN